MPQTIVVREPSIGAIAWTLPPELEEQFAQFEQLANQALNPDQAQRCVQLMREEVQLTMRMLGHMMTASFFGGQPLRDFEIIRENMEQTSKILLVVHEGQEQQ